MSKHLVAALYKFVDLPDFCQLKKPIEQACRDREILGTILLAEEGINGTIAGREVQLRGFLKWLKTDPRFVDLEHKESWSVDNPFYRMKVRLKKEIVTLGVDGINPSKQVGSYVDAHEWNELISDPEVVLIDTRNDYEVSIGSFHGAIDPQTTSFREFPNWLNQQKHLSKKTKIAMYCTGGIRCEKSTALLKAEGFEDVYHLKGGILKYLETVPESESLWDGECFVFDQRVSVGHGLAQGHYDLCHACRHPITQNDKQSPHYRRGVSCPHCHDKVQPAQKRRFEERQKQIDLARDRGQKHIAADQVKQKAQKKAKADAAKSMVGKSHG